MAAYEMSPERPGSWRGWLTPDVVAVVRRLGSPRVSPDGVHVAYVESHDGQTALYVVPVSGGLTRRLTTDRPGGDYVWLPDGRAIVYAARGDLVLAPIDGSPIRRVVESVGRLAMPVVSPDGRRVAFVVDTDGETAVAYAELPSGAVAGSGSDAPEAWYAPAWPVRLSHGDERTMAPRWLPDGRGVVWTAYALRRMPWDESRILMRMLDGDERVVVAAPGVAHTQPCPSPDGRSLAFLSNRSGWLTLWLADLATGVLQQLGPDEYEHGNPAWPFDIRDLAWSPDSVRIAHLRTVDGRTGIALYDRTTAERRMLTDVPGTHSQLSWCGTGALVCTYTAPGTPPSIVRIDIESSARTILASGAPLAIDAARAAIPEHITFSATDGRDAHALLYAPTGVRSSLPCPLLVQVHGGPTGQAGEEWNGPIQYFVGRGWAVLQLNYRGSSGYGKAYTDALNGMWGEGELRDALGAVDSVLERGTIDPDRIVIWGASSGGYAVLYALTHAPGRFAAGVCLYGISDLVALAESSVGFEQFYTDTLVGPLPDAWARMRELSPLSCADAVRDPLLIFHGGRDTDVPIEQAERMVEALRRAGKDVEYQVYPEERHGWSRSATVVDYLERMDRFLHRTVLLR